MNNARQQVTIKDVAKACGVSATTVSLALRNHARITEATKEKIKTAAKRLGYKRNPLISALMSNIGRSRPSDSAVPLAVVYNISSTEAEESPYQCELWRGITVRAVELGFSVERFFLSDAKIGSARRLTEILYNRGVGGVLIPPLAKAGGHLSLDWSRFAAVAIGYSMFRPQLHRVCPDQYQSIRLALHKIRHYGYSRPGLVINGFSGVRTLHLWSSGFYGYEHALNAQSIIPVLECGEVDEVLLMKWYKKHRPDVIIASGKEMAIWKTLRQADFVEISSIGFVSLCRSREIPEVAGINENEYQVGRAAVDQAVQQLYYNERGIPEHSHVLQIAPSWEDGATCTRQNV